MAFNVRSGGKAESVPVPETVVSGDVVRVGEIVGIAEIDATEGADGNHYTTLALEGIAHAPLDGALDVGAAVYVDGSGDLTGTGAVGGKAVGYATREKLAGDSDVWFKLVPSVTAAPTA